MRAIVHDRYGPPEVLRLEEAERPAPAQDEVLVRVHATSVTRSDCGWRSAKPFFIRVFTGLRRPRRRILGGEMAGEVVAVGGAVHELGVGDRVFGAIGWGANAEYVAVRTDRPIARMPDGLSFEDAAGVCDGYILAEGSLRPARLEPGMRVLVYGASGSIGVAAVQIAKACGADLTAVCGTEAVELVRSLGADRVIDRTREDFTRGAETYDVIFDAVGKHSFRRCRRSLRPGGIFITTDLGFMWHAPLLVLLTRWFGQKRVLVPAPGYTKEAVLRLRSLVEAGRYRAVIDRRYPLEKAVEATRYVETGQKIGNVVLTVVDDHPS